MSRINRIFVVYFALLYLILESHAESSNFTRKSSIEFYHDDLNHIVKVNNSIIMIGTYDNFINMTTPDGVTINICEYSLPPNRSHYETNRAVALGNGKIVVQMLIHSEYERIIKDLLMIVDPHNCSSIKTIDTKVNNIYVGYGLQSIVPYHDSFDLFYSKYVEDPENLMLKTPRRFNDLAEPIHLDDHFGLETDAQELQVETVKPYDASEGYICRQIFFNNSTRLIRLDSKFQVVKEVNFVPVMWKMSATYDRIGLCYVYHEDNVDMWSSICDFFEPKNLSRQASVHMFKSRNDYQVSSVEIANLPDGSSIAALSFELRDWFSDRGFAKEFYLQRVNADGSTEMPVYVDTYYNMMNLASETSIVLMDGGEVCLVVIDTWLEAALAKRRVNTKCVVIL